jgi:hypothetical protein
MTRIETIDRIRYLASAEEVPQRDHDVYALSHVGLGIMNLGAEVVNSIRHLTSLTTARPNSGLLRTKPIFNPMERSENKGERERGMRSPTS